VGGELSSLVEEYSQKSFVASCGWSLSENTPGMQSYFQSRRLGLAAKAQIERDVEKAALRTRDNPLNTENGVLDGDITADAVLESAAQSERAEADTDGEKPRIRNDGSSERVDLDESDSSASSSPNGSVEDFTTADRVQTRATQYTVGTALGHSLTGILARDRRTHEGKGEKVFVVGWEGPDDPLNPRNWDVKKRISCTLQISLIAATVGAASGIDSTVLPQAAKDLGVSDVAESLATGALLMR
jgi:hypothetical protein